MKRGKLIVIEGPDASGKATQAAELVKHLRHNRCRVHAIAFPQYGHRSARFVKLLIGGTFGPATYVSPFLSAMFFLLDQVSARNRLMSWLKHGDYVVADRYVPSNVAHQGAKLGKARGRSSFVHWLEDLSYKTFGLPKPDLVIFLDVPSSVRERLLQTRGRGRDDFESNMRYFRRVLTVYRTLARQEHWARIACTQRGRMRTSSAIAQDVWRMVSSMS